MTRYALIGTIVAKMQAGAKFRVPDPYIRIRSNKTERLLRERTEIQDQIALGLRQSSAPGAAVPVPRDRRSTHRKPVERSRSMNPAIAATSHDGITLRQAALVAGFSYLLNPVTQSP